MNNKKTNSEIQWNKTNNRFVTFMDIMGFKDMLFRNEHNYVLEKMEKIAIPVKSIDKEVREILTENKRKYDLDIQSTLIRPVIFSDSILLISNDDSEDALFNILFFTESLIVDTLSNGIPIKGAIALGELTADFDNSLYFGKPLIDAYELQDEINLYGIVLHNTVEKYIIENNCNHILNDFFYKYDVPLKNGHAYHYLMNLELLGDNNIERATEIAKLYCNVSGKIRQYIDNTVNFFQERWKEEGN